MKSWREQNTAELRVEERRYSAPMSEDEAARLLRQTTRRSFLVAGTAMIASVAGWMWLPDAWRHQILVGNFRWNETLSRRLFREGQTAPEFPRARASERVNGDLGLSDDFDPAHWRLKVSGTALTPGELSLGLPELAALPRTEMTVELKCIEGWSVIVNWAGVRFADFFDKYPPAGRDGRAPGPGSKQDQLPPYVSLATPDMKYYVGWDLASMLHPQTLLAYEMNGQPLTSEHGAPLRLACTAKYGIKQLKRIGQIAYTWDRPADYWAERGYDWYAGL